MVREQVELACKRGGRPSSEVEILAATKYVNVEDLGAFAEAGIALVGENRAQDMLVKHGRWGDTFTWDFIGHLQSRKVRDLLPIVRLIHSLSSSSALQQIDRRSHDVTQVLLEVNVGGEESKSGIDPRALDGFVERSLPYEKVRFVGLMAMPPVAPEPEQSRGYFASLRQLAEQLTQRWSPRHTFETLSMGTSQDYVVAVEEGATLVRLGSALFS